MTETEYLSAKTAMESSRANLAAANDASSKSVISVNRNGVIANLSLERHQQVSPGDDLFTLVNEDEMKLEVGVSSQTVNKIKVGSEAKIKIDELDKEITGIVYEVSAFANNSARQFVVKIRITNSGREIKSGMYGTASINTGTEQGIIIPKNAIVVRGVQQVVYIVREGKAVSIPITISNQNDINAAVKGEGLSAGVELIIEGQNVLQENEKIRKVQ